MDLERVYTYSFESIYRMYVQKVERKGRTIEELDEVLCWLTGYDQAGLEAEMSKGSSLNQFFDSAPAMNAARDLITGVICGVRVENIQEPLMKSIRQMDKVVDELAKGKKMEKILREVSA